MTRAETPTFEGQPGDGAGPVFGEVWQAQAFAITIALHERGVINWPEWTGALSDAIRAAQAAGDPDQGTTYYNHWLNALERLVVKKGLTTTASLKEMAQAWEDAAHATPHGQPILLESAPGRAEK